ncbi:MAG: haloacid dehalogenase type II [Betaproteobacteria bacterium]|nr:haloacid dehalogenase type II [Betaproteobacteria bacterium]
MKLGDFSTLTFDCYGTLIDWETGLLHALAPLLARHGRRLDEESILVAFGEAESTTQERAPGKLYPEILGAALEALAAPFGIALEPADRSRFGASVGEWPAFADSAPALVYLQRYYRLVILSNVDRASFARSQSRLGVEFDRIFTAQDIGSYKPDLRNFRYMLDELGRDGIAPRQVLHVAQSLFHDHVPAKQLGLATVWVNRRAGKPGSGATPPAQARPDWEVTSLAELADLHRRERSEP